MTTPHPHAGSASALAPCGRAPIRAVIVGASGYTGAELIDILLRHPHASLVGLFGSGGRSAGEQPLEDLWPRFRGRCGLRVQPLASTSQATTPTGGRPAPSAAPNSATSPTVDPILRLEPDAAFLATPHEASLDLAAALVGRVGVVIDLSAAFRLSNPDAYPKFYNFAHSHPDLLTSAIYGLPEITRSRLPGARLIAAPGCYPTSAILPLHPLAKAGAIKPGYVPVIDSTSGVSGAGRTPAARAMFCEVSQSPYGVLRHRHTPEIAEHAGTPVHFVPHLGPYDRGILTTIHLDLADGWHEARVRATLEAAYRGERFVRVLPAGAWPSVNEVRGTNFCDIALTASDDGRHIVLCSAIDNLIKGASGQAVQAMNAALGLDEVAGLL